MLIKGVNMSRPKNLLSFLLVSIFLLGLTSLSYGQSGVFDRIGVIPEHGSSGSFPEENIDLFTGNVTLHYRDIYLPGPNGLNVEVWRVYNSKVLKDRQTGQLPSVQAYHQSWIGMGWTMHMGMVHQETSNTPIIEFPDGRLETAYPDNYGVNKHLTYEFLKYDKTEHKLYFQNGITWTYGATATITRADGSQDAVRLVTQIKNSFGQSIAITYNSGTPTINTITDGYGRVITFTSSGTPRILTQITLKDAVGNNKTYQYTVGTFINGYTKLISFLPPCLPATNFEYNDGSSNDYELKKVTTSYGGIVEYSYDNHIFSFNETQLNSRVLVQRKIKFNTNEPYCIWNYEYPDYNGVAKGTVHIDGPEYDANIVYNCYDPDCPWKLGAIDAVQYEDDSFSEAYEWAYQQISNQSWYVLGTNMGTAKGILLDSFSRHREGNATIKEKYLYERPEAKKYGLRSKTLYYINQSETPINYETLTYFFEYSSGYKDRFILGLPYQQYVYSGDGILLKGKKTSFYEETGKWGAVKRISVLKDDSTYCNWDYYYQINDTLGLVQIIVKGPEGSSTSIWYKYGVRQSQSLGDTTLYTCNISQYDSSVTSVINQDESLTSFVYDGLGRVILENFPDDRNDITTDWMPNNTNTAVTTQGDAIHGYHTITRYWDGMGRDTGYTEAGDGTTLYYLKTLDAEGRLKTQSVGGTDSQHQYQYAYNAAGDIIQVIDPIDGTTHTTHIAYTGITRTVTDPNGHITTISYNHLPGLPTACTDAQGHIATYTYDSIGRLIGVSLEENRNHSFQYDRNDNIISETHPETGLITYTYSDENWLGQRSWEGTIANYVYTTADGRLFKVATGDGTNVEEEITYLYTTHSRLYRVSSTKGWLRKDFIYDPYGNVTSETICIPGLADKTITYTYDRNNNLKRITYPDGNWAEITSNSLDMPESLAFSSENNLIVGTSSYGPGKAITSRTFSRNGTQYSASYFASGELDTASLTKGAATLYNASYQYDGVRNVLSISSTAPIEPLNATFNYDSLNRLISANYTSGRVNAYSYTYDANGNITKVQEDDRTPFNKTYNNNNRINGENYDARGNLTSIETPIETKYLFWDKKNQLDHVTDASGVVLAKYLYDERGLRIRALPPLPEMDIKSSGTTIHNGEDLTFECTVAGQYTDKTLTIENNGDESLNLTGSPRVSISGTDADQFSVLAQPSSPILPSGNESFIVRFNPTSLGNIIAIMSIANDDPQKNPYQITLKGNLIPEINIIGMASGGTYNFGNVAMGELAEKTFTIQSLGCGSLILNGTPHVSLSGDKYGQFEVTQQPDGTISPGNTSQFVVQFSPMKTGTFTAMLSIANNDPDENPYIIYLSATGVSSSAKTADESTVDNSSLVGAQTEMLCKSNHKNNCRPFFVPAKTNCKEGPNNLLNKEHILSQTSCDIGPNDLFINLFFDQGRNSKKGPVANGMDIQTERNMDLTAQPTETEYISYGKRADRTADEAATKSSSPCAGTYYIYTFDGKLLAAYDVHGVCVKDYIYMGNQLVAEYDPVPNQYYYYTKDQLRSTQIVTNDSGSAVYSEAYDPYGGIQKTWINTFEPIRKYADKERDAESDLDYFGARYYANIRYRWLSPDLSLNTESALKNPQRWNLYSYALNNPITFLDADGRVVICPSAKDFEALKKSLGDPTLASKLTWDPVTGEVHVEDGGEKTNNPNFESLKELINSEIEFRVTVVDRVEYLDKENNYKVKWLQLGEGFNGLTIFPKKGRATKFVHDSESIRVAVARAFYANDSSAQARTLAHELYGHAYLYFKGGAYLHEMRKDMKGLNPDGKVNKYIDAIENRNY